VKYTIPFELEDIIKPMIRIILASTNEQIDNIHKYQPDRTFDHRSRVSAEQMSYNLSPERSRDPQGS
jgi:hypothetical protein